VGAKQTELLVDVERQSPGCNEADCQPEREDGNGDE
jgi:hypothetical protein